MFIPCLSLSNVIKMLDFQLLSGYFCAIMIIKFKQTNKYYFKHAYNVYLLVLAEGVSFLSYLHAYNRRFHSHMAKLGEMRGRIRVLYSEFGEITGKLDFAMWDYKWDVIEEANSSFQ